MAGILITKFEGAFPEGEAKFTLAFDSTFSFSKDLVDPEIPDTLINGIVNFGLNLQTKQEL